MDTTTDRAAAIRAALKAKGITSRQVSVRADYYSMGSSIRIVIKDPKVSASVVKAIAEPHESIDRDQFGDILSGGNRFVDVHYSSEAFEALGAAYLPALEAASIELKAASQNALIPIAGTTFRLGLDGYHGGAFAIWNDGGHVQNAYDLKHLASVLGARMLDESEA